MAKISLETIVKQLGLEIVVGKELLKKEVSGCYCGDLLSDVMANSKEGDLWITIQTHQNIVAVAVLKEHSGIIIAGGKEPDPETIEKAQKEGICILRANQNAFEISGMLYEILKGIKDEGD